VHVGARLASIKARSCTAYG